MDKRFDEIVAYLEKRFDVKINVADRALAERRFIASFVNGESLDEMLARSMPTRRCAFAAKAASSTSPNANPQKKPPME